MLELTQSAAVELNALDATLEVLLNDLEDEDARAESAQMDSLVADATDGKKSVSSRRHNSAPTTPVKESMSCAVLQPLPNGHTQSPRNEALTNAQVRIREFCFEAR